MFFQNPGFAPASSQLAANERLADPKKPNPLVVNRQQNTAGLWSGGLVSLNVAPLTNPTAQWDSPIFDTRPDLPFKSQGLQEATPVYRSKTGDWGSLWVQVEGLNQIYGVPGGGGKSPQTGLQVTYDERCSPNDPSRVQVILDPVNITTQFATLGTKQATLLQFKPSTDVDPVRYWQVRIFFDWIQTFTVAPVLRVSAAYY